MNLKLKGSLILMLTALIWGVAFVAQSSSMEFIGPFTFNALRSLLGAFTMVLVVLFNSKKINFTKNEIKSGLICGTFLFCAMSLQQLGVMHTSVAKAGFITSLYIIFVLIFSIFLKTKVTKRIVLAIVLALVGLYLLCMDGALIFAYGDLLVLISSLFFAMHIMAIEKMDNVRVSNVSLIQFLVCFVFSLVITLFTESFSVMDVQSAMVPILYAGVMSCGVAYTLQMVGQKYVTSTVASLILSLESVFSAVAGFILLNQTLNFKEIVGCSIMFMAIIIAQKNDEVKNER